MIASPRAVFFLYMGTFIMVGALIIAYQILLSRLWGYLRRNEPELWKSLGEPDFWRSLRKSFIPTVNPIKEIKAKLPYLKSNLRLFYGPLDNMKPETKTKICRVRILFYSSMVGLLVLAAEFLVLVSFNAGH